MAPPTEEWINTELCERVWTRLRTEFPQPDEVIQTAVTRLARVLFISNYERVFDFYCEQILFAIQPTAQFNKWIRGQKCIKWLRLAVEAQSAYGFKGNPKDVEDLVTAVVHNEIFEIARTARQKLQDEEARIEAEQRAAKQQAIEQQLAAARIRTEQAALETQQVLQQTEQIRADLSYQTRQIQQITQATAELTIHSDPEQ